MPWFAFIKLRKLHFPTFAAATIPLTVALAAPAQTAHADPSVLQRRYEAAQKFQAANDLPHAAEQYRIFIADALGQVAVGRAQANQYEMAADSFDEALRLVPEFPTLQLEYARAALSSGNLERAKILAGALVHDVKANAKTLAGAHAVLGRVLLKQNRDMEAKQQFEAAVGLDPNFENGYELAVADLDLGDHDAAAQIFREMLTSFGDTAAIHLYFGQAYGTSDFQAEAVREFRQAIAKDKDLPGVHYSLASAFLTTSGTSKLPDVEKELRAEIAISPKDPAAFAALGHLLAGEHESAAVDVEAERDLKHAVELDPKSPDAYLYLGQFYAETKRPGEAEAALRQSIAHTTDLSRGAFQVQKAHYLLGRLLLGDGKQDEGKAEIAAAQNLTKQNLSQDQTRMADYLQDSKSGSMASPNPTMPMAVENKPEDPEAARKVDTFEKQIAPAIADSYNNLGAIAGSEGDFRAALADFKHTAEWNPTMPGLDYNWGRAAFQSGDFVTASQLLTRCLQENSSNDSVKASLGVSLFMTRDYPGARRTLQPLDGKADSSAQVRFAYAESLVETGDVNEGVQRLLSLEKANPEVPEVHRALASVFASQHAPQATTEYETALRLDPRDWKAHEELGQLQLSRGETRAAVQQFEAALKLQPDNTQLERELSAAKLGQASK